MYFFLSVFLHAAILFSLVAIWSGHPEKERKKPAMYVPSYTYQKQNQPQPAMTQPKQERVKPKELKADKDGIEKNAISTATQIRHASDMRTSSSTKVAEAINLIGDKKTIPQPLIILLGKALTKHLTYPKIAIDFKVRGTAFVGFVLHPDGTLTNIQLVQSSQAGVLDSQAVAAVTAISPLKNTSNYLSQPKPMVVGILFN